MNVLIGIGDSWTSGIGGIPDYEKPANYPDDRNYFYWHGEDLDKIPNYINKELTSSWVNKLASKLNVVPINLGVPGSGNKGSIKSLHLNDIAWNNINGGYLIYMLSTRIRFDLFDRSDIEELQNSHQRPFYTITLPDEEADPVSYEKHTWWYKNIYSESIANNTTIMSILEAQHVSKLKNLKFYFCFAFEDCSELMNTNKLSSKIDWDRCLTKNTSFLKILADLQNTPDIIEYYNQLNNSTEYISKCGHPTSNGYSYIADYMFDQIIEK
jgi:hypothetical protein